MMTVTPLKHVVGFTMYYCWVFMEISKPAHFWKAYNMRNLKTYVYICAETSMAAILDFQNGPTKEGFSDICASN